MLANAELEEFAHISSHDLKEPIRNINSFSSLIERRISSITNEELLDYLSIIRFNAGQMQLLVNAVYEFVHINKEDILVGIVNVSEVVEDVRRVLQKHHSGLQWRGGIKGSPGNRYFQSRHAVSYTQESAGERVKI